MLFSDERKHRISVPATDSKGIAVTVGWLVDYLCDEVMKDNRKEMFVLDGHVYANYTPLYQSRLFTAPQVPPKSLNVFPAVKSSNSTFHYLIQSLCKPSACQGYPLSFHKPLSASAVFAVSHYISPASNLGSNIANPLRHSLTAARASSRPGILVLINDADWELEGEATYALQPNDNILFVSTLHGG